MPGVHRVPGNRAVLHRAAVAVRHTVTVAVGISLVVLGCTVGHIGTIVGIIIDAVAITIDIVITDVANAVAIVIIVVLVFVLGDVLAVTMTAPVTVVIDSVRP